MSDKQQQEASTIRFMIAGQLECGGPHLYFLRVQGRPDEVDPDRAHDTARLMAKSVGLGELVVFDDKDGPSWLFELVDWESTDLVVLSGNFGRNNRKELSFDPSSLEVALDELIAQASMAGMSSKSMRDVLKQHAEALPEWDEDDKGVRRQLAASNAWANYDLSKLDVRTISGWVWDDATESGTLHFSVKDQTGVLQSMRFVVAFTPGTSEVRHAYVIA